MTPCSSRPSTPRTRPTQTDLYKQMETMLADTAANVYIQDLCDLVAMRQDLGGLGFYPIYVLDLSTVYLTQR
ncbi:MAG: hypothetical protein V8S97_02975 [Oscillospiraceae bacterium]